ncbi:hypothetical protein pb186bvf_017188 [Paramecium bursaria]
MQNKLLDNINQQSKRLLEQLKDLEEYKNELEPEEYQSMKNDTALQLQDFQKMLLNLQSGDLQLKTAIQQQQDLIKEAVKQSFNADEIRNLMQNSQTTNIRERIKQLDQSQQLGKISKQQQIKDTLQLINQLSDLGIPLQQNEKDFLQQNTGKDNFVQNEGDLKGNQLLKTANQQLENQLK